MRKSLIVMLVVTIIATFSTIAYAATVGMWQCSVCGQQIRITHHSSVLPARDLYGDGHVHQWQYQGR